LARLVTENADAAKLVWVTVSCVAGLVHLAVGALVIVDQTADTDTRWRIIVELSGLKQQ